MEWTGLLCAEVVSGRLINAMNFFFRDFCCSAVGIFFFFYMENVVAQPNFIVVCERDLCVISRSPFVLWLTQVV